MCYSFLDLFRRIDNNTIPRLVNDVKVWIQTGRAAIFSGSVVSESAAAAALQFVTIGAQIKHRAEIFNAASRAAAISYFFIVFLPVRDFCMIELAATSERTEMIIAFLSASAVDIIFNMRLATAPDL